MTRTTAGAASVAVNLALAYLMAWGLFTRAGGGHPADQASSAVTLLVVLTYGVILSPVAWAATLPLQYGLYRAFHRPPVR
jgi:hypothetical protein